MKYFAKDLQSVYEILKTLPKPLAVLGFLCGSVGGEFEGSQSIGGQFYDKWNQSARVVALCWEGASILYANVSDDQIEFTDKEQSRFGDKIGQGWRKKNWLANQGYEDRIAAIAGIVAYSGPVDATAKGMKKHYGLGNAARWKVIEERLTRTGYIFSTENPPLVQEPYIAIFDRNERIDKRRNTRMRQVRLFRRWAENFGFKLVVVSDCYPRNWQNVIRIPFADRNLDRLCNIIHHAVLYAAPASGSAIAGWIFGCNFVQLVLDLNDVWPILTKTVIPDVLEGRGFRHFGILDSPDGEVANSVREHLKEKGKK